MTIGFIVVAIAFTVVMTVHIFRPFARSRREQMSFELIDEDLREVESLVARKVALVQALRDIEYDFQTHKISEEDYRRFKRSCERQAVAVMRRLDKLHGGDRDWESVIDQAVADRMKSSQTQTTVDVISDRPKEQSIDDDSRDSEQHSSGEWTTVDDPSPSSEVAR